MSEPQLSFDRDGYSEDRAQGYAAHHAKNARTRLTTSREGAVVGRALRLAGSPREVLDLPCGTGRFWPALASAGVASVVAADNSDGMLAVAARQRIPGLDVQLLKSSAFAIDLPDRAVPFAASLRLMHHLAVPDDRLRVLGELRRVSSAHVLVSLWTDGNLHGWRRARRSDKRVAVKGFGRRICLPRQQVEDEMRTAGFVIVARWRIWPFVSAWTVYLLRRDDAG